MSCGVGKRTRTRVCLAINGNLYGQNCEGSNVDYEICEMPSCDCRTRLFPLFRREILNSVDFAAFLGWSAWSDWSDCTEDGERVRQRKCLTTSPEPNECQGDEREARVCRSGSDNGKESLD